MPRRIQRPTALSSLRCSIWKEPESIDAMRAAFDADLVDISIAGDKEDVEIEVGLRKKRDTPKPRYQPLLEMLMARSKVQWRTPPAEQRDWGTPH